MIPARPAAASISLLVVAGLLSGCSSAPTSPGNAPTQAAASRSVSPTGAATSAPSAADAAVSQAAPVTDADGYTFSVVWDYTPQAFTKDISSEKPGYSAIRIRLQSTITVTNTTAGRALTFRSFSSDDVTFALVAQWPGTSAPCKAIHPDASAPCSIELAHTQPGSELAADASSTSTTYAGPINYDAGLAHIPDADYDAVLAALQHPASYAVTYTAADNDRFKDACHDPDLRAVMADALAPNSAANLFNASHMPLWDTSGTCHATVQLAQPPSE